MNKTNNLNEHIFTNVKEARSYLNRIIRKVVHISDSKAIENEIDRIVVSIAFNVKQELGDNKYLQAANYISIK